MFRKVLTASAVAILLACMPVAVAAQEREIRSADQASAFDWLASIWGDVAAWFNLHVDGRCTIDPDGCPHGAPAPAQPAPESLGDGRCSLDPNGCPGGA